MGKVNKEGGGSTLQSKQRWCEIEAFTSRFIHSSAKLARFHGRMLCMWVNESAANSTLAPPLSGLKDALFHPAITTNHDGGGKLTTNQKRGRTNMHDAQLRLLALDLSEQLMACSV